MKKQLLCLALFAISGFVSAQQEAKNSKPKPNYSNETVAEVVKADNNSLATNSPNLQGSGMRNNSSMSPENLKMMETEMSKFRVGNDAIIAKINNSNATLIKPEEGRLNEELARKKSDKNSISTQSADYIMSPEHIKKMEDEMTKMRAEDVAKIKK